MVFINFFIGVAVRVTDFFIVLASKFQLIVNKSYLKLKIKTPELISRSVQCPWCGWNGTVAESLKNGMGNDECPDCGETHMAYKL